MIVPLYLEIGHSAVPLGGLDPGVPQEVLDGHQGGVGIEELRGHGVLINVNYFFPSTTIIFPVASSVMLPGNAS